MSAEAVTKDQATEPTDPPAVTDPPADPPASDPPADPTDPPADPPADPTKGKKNGGTVLDDPAAAAAEPKPGEFPEDWRKQLAGEDAKLLKRLEKMESPHTLLKSWRDAEKRLTDGSQRTTLTPPEEGADEAEVKAWREANGIPEAAGDYEITLPDGMQVGDDDKPMLAHFAEAAHKAGMPASMLSTMVEAYYQLEEIENDGLMEDDEAYRDRTVDALRDQMGAADYKRAIAGVRHLFAGAGEKIKIENPGPGEEAEMGIEEAILGARMPNGRKIGGDEQALRYLIRVGAELLPAGEEVPDGATKGALADRLGELREIMRTDIARWDASPGLRKEYEDLVDAKLRRERRSGEAA